MKQTVLNRVLSLMLCFSLLAGYLPPTVFAEDLSQQGLCEHHQAHVGCAYASAVEAVDCGHEHTDSCFAAEEVCVHVHEDCGTEDIPCEHVCAKETGCISKVPACSHTHDDACGYREAKAPVACDFVCEECTSQTTQEQTSVEELQEIIQALPSEVTQENLQTVGAQLSTIDALRLTLTEEELAQVDFTRYQNAIAAVNTLNGMTGAEIPSESATSGTCGSDLIWEYDSTIRTLTISGSGSMTNYSYDTLPPWWQYLREDITAVVLESGITRIGDFAFIGCSNLTSIEIPDSVTAIGDSAFQACGSLTSIQLPDGVARIGADAFYGCGITTIEIPAAIKSISDYMFYGCRTLTHISIPAGITSIGYSAFDGCYNLTSIDFPDSITYISVRAFASCGLTNITIPASVKNIGSSAFEGCSSLESIIFSGDAPTISEDAFTRVTATAWYPAGNYTWNHKQANYGGTLSWQRSACNHTVENDICTKCHSYGYCGENLFWTVEEDSILRITGTGMMRDFSESDLSEFAPWTERWAYDLQTVIIEDGVSCIGAYAFYSCLMVSHVDIPDSVQSIGICAFDSCESLEKVTIGSGVISIASDAFSLCSELAEIIFLGDAPTIHNRAFSNVTATASYYANNPTWTGEKKQNYGGTITWEAYDPCADGHNYSDGICTVCGAKDLLGSGTCGNNLTWELDKYGTLTISGTGAMDNYTTSSPAPWNSYAYNVTSLVIDDTVTAIGDRAFRNFQNCTSLAMPESLEYLGEGSFYNMTQITSLTIPSGITEIPAGTFYGWKGLTELRIPEGITTLAFNCLTGCEGLVTLHLPTSLRTIESDAIWACYALETVLFAGTAEQWAQVSVGIGNDSLTAATILCTEAAGTCGDDLTWVLYSDGLLEITGNGSIPSYSYGIHSPFYDFREKITKVILSDGITKIGSYVFDADYPNLEYVQIPTSVSIITGSAFGATYSKIKRKYLGTMEQWENITIGSYVSYGNQYGAVCTDGEIRYMGNCGTGVSFRVQGDGILKITGSGSMSFYQYLYDSSHFSGDDGITKVIIGDGITSIGGYAFYNCKNLTSVSIPDTVKSIGSDAFYNCTSLETIQLPAEVTSISTAAFKGCSNLKNINIPETVTYIGSECFYDCSSLSSVSLPAGIKGIYESTFRNCSGLKEITVPTGVTSVGSFAFSGCSGLTGINLPDTLNAIDQYAFYGCSSLKEMEIPSKVTAINGFVFEDCSNLKQITIPAGVTTIYSGAFAECNSLTDVYYIGTEEQWNQITIYNANTCLTNAAIHFVDPCASGHDFGEDSVCTRCGAVYTDYGITLEDTQVTSQNISGENWSYNEQTNVLRLNSPWSGAVKINRDSLTVEINGTVSLSGLSATAETITLKGVSGKTVDNVQVSKNYSVVITSPDGITGNLTVENLSLSANADGTPPVKVGAADGTYVGAFTIKNADVSVRSTYEGGTSDAIVTGTIHVEGNSYVYSRVRMAGCYAVCTYKPGSSFSSGCHVELGGINPGSCGLYAESGLNLPEEAYFYKNSGYQLLNKSEILNESGGYRSSGSFDLIGTEHGVGYVPQSGYDGKHQLKCTNCTSPTTLIWQEDCAYRYTAGGATITAGCTKCSNVYTLTVKAPENLSADDTAKTAVTEGCIYGVDTPQILYTGNTTDGVPVAPGTYTASITLGDATACVEYTILGNEEPDPDQILDSGSCGADVTWILLKDGTMIISGSGAMDDYNGLDRPWEDYVSYITSVVVQEGVTSVGEVAFYNCFNLKTVLLPASLTVVAYQSFEACKQLESIVIPSGVTQIGNRVFAECTSLKHVELPAGLKKIGAGAFSECVSLETVNLPDGLTDIDFKAFYGCEKLTELIIPDSVTTLGNDALSYCTKLQKVTLSENLAELESNLFYGCSALAEIVIPGNVKIIWNQAFSGCSALKKITFAGSAPGIYDDAFQSVEATAYYPENYASWTSDRCRNYGGALTWVTYDNGMTETEDDLNAVLQEGSCGTDVTWVLTKDGTLTISGSGTINGYNNASDHPWAHYASHIITVKILEGVTAVGDRAFCDCFNLKNVYISEDVTSIGSLAFNGCKLLESVAIPSGVTQISNRVFAECTSLKHVELPAGLKKIGAGAFSECVSLETVNLPDGLTDIDFKAFYGCEKLTELIIPDSVTTLGNDALSYCTKLQKVTLSENLAELESNLFYGCSALAEIVIPGNVKIIWNQAFSGCSALKKITFAGSAPGIYDDAFQSVEATAYYPGDDASWTADKLVNYSGTLTWVSYSAVENRLVLDSAEFGSYATVWIDGVELSIQKNGDYWYVDLPDGNAKTMVAYTYHVDDASDVHTQYPTSMKVWTLSNEDGIYTATRVEELDDILQYSGMSIRVTGKKGIRMITSIDQAKKAALTSGGLAGYTLKEYGTVVAWINQMGENPLVLGRSYAKSNYAYRQGKADPVFGYEGSLMQYTNVLVGFSNAQCGDDLALRPYMILADGDGNEITIYGGVVQRSIGYIALQNRDIFDAGTNAYEYVWNIIRNVYGDAYDAEYKG